ncbi:MAG: histidine--tRNA ligase [Thermonemataceae bacterium]|nr:histidine--tRNA ligase [Thermonemataceae bacterium]
MKIQKPSLPRGTRDYNPAMMLKRNFIINQIRNVFEKFGFMPLETPAMENLSVLMGKYGEEGDQLLYKILNQGDFLKETTHEDITKGAKHLALKISEKGLRYDLTVPFARFVVMNQNDLAFPFKRYQIQPVWRGDAPQKGRYREFYQCDADVVGTNSLICEAEIILMMQEVLGEKLKIKNYRIKINNRKILTGISETIGASGKEAELCVAIDKLDKIGKEKVLEELKNREFSEENLVALDPIFELPNQNKEKLDFLESFLAHSAIGKEGIAELKAVFDYVEAFDSQTSFPIEIDITLARGLSYYTGAIFEVKVQNSAIGSISGGGRYDNLTGTFGLAGIAGVGFSFGLDRIFDVMEEQALFPSQSENSTQIMLSNFDSSTEKYALGILKKLRTEGIKAEIYPQSSKLDKQLKYANKKQIPFVLLIGSDEMNAGIFTLKNMLSGTQEQLDLAAIIQKLLS